ncbi:hypothetical protein NBZ79_05815 [Sneathiella marina]|uniref:Potassium channel domain-containing protein n=1 Tax=Sneathiella marina TaxID=2950108 RepID=A0ABY4W6N7_9PROT|nr:hypothetical protein [Sneathiella marina]USG62489.1 hypothetical protein NBZ79_05815 [Sneathiella marina]
MKVISKNKHTSLFATLMILLLVSPIIDDEATGAVLLPALFSLVLIACTLVVDKSRHQTLIVLSFAVPWAYLTWLHPSLSDYPVANIANFILVTCTIYVALILLIGISSTEKVSRDIIFGAITVYLMVGIAWTIVYALIENFRPSSFDLGATENGLIWNRLIYFSFSIITTLGYGVGIPFNFS